MLLTTRHMGRTKTRRRPRFTVHAIQRVLSSYEGAYGPHAQELDGEFGATSLVTVIELAHLSVSYNHERLTDESTIRGETFALRDHEDV
ncbi:hypothetical protein WG66_012354 [Moniliophthora roreri]|nr:hypothetical protein WG66_012354 [Moniliophthora roreri]